MSHNHYHICVPTTDIVKVKKWSTASTEPDTLPDGKFNQEKITPKIQEIIKNPANLKDEQIQKVGESLFEALFDKDLREDFLYFYTEVVKKKKQILQVILEINEIAMPEVVAYPWELMCLPEKYNQGDIHFATDRKLSFFRCRYQLKDEAKLSIKVNQGEPLKISLVVSKPTSDPQLNNVEYQEVNEYLKSLDNLENNIKFLPLMNSASFSQIVERLEEDTPDIFHFIGHGQLIEKNGEDIGQIAFVNDAGKADWKDAKMFSQLFSGHTPKIVILQACETGKQSETNAFSSVAFRLMLQGIPVVIAMQYKVSNQTATSFVTEFYSQIIKGNSVEVAVQKSRSKLAMDNGYEKRDFAIPVIYMNAYDACLSKIERITYTKDILQQQELERHQERYNQVDKLSRELSEKITELERGLNYAYDEEKKINLNRSIAHEKAKHKSYEDELSSLAEKISSIRIELSNNC